MHAIIEQDCCENSSRPNRHGIGKGPMTANGAPIKKYGMGKGLMTQSCAYGKKHGIGKGLMAVWTGTNPDAIDFPYVGYCSGSATQKKKKKRVQPRESVLVCTPIHFFSYLQTIIFLEMEIEFSYSLCRENWQTKKKIRRRLLLEIER